MTNSLYSEIKEIILSTKKIFFVVFLILLILYLISGIYSISQNQRGVLLRFGKIINRYVPPGIHYAIPYPVDKIYKVPVTTINRVVIDDFYSDMMSDESNSYLFYQMTGLSSYCITGDNNIIGIKCVLQYIVTDPVKYIFRLSPVKTTKQVNFNVESKIKTEKLIKNVVSNILIRCIARLKVDDILTIKKREIVNYVARKSQEKLDKIDCGLSISSVELKNVKPPDSVQQYFDDVINSKIDKRKMVNHAEAYRNEKLPQAKADASRLIFEAQSYKEKVITKAEGESQRFLDMLNQYKDSKQITKKRLYLEFIKKIFPDIKDKFIISNINGKTPVKLKLNTGE